MNPRLSVVATSRNDDHGGSLLIRMQLFIDGFAEQAARFQFPVELVVVEWNPPADRPPLAEALSWKRNDVFHARIVTVPPEVHASLPNASRLPLFQMIGKNVGIRRAQADFVLATNVDILLSDELFAHLAQGLEADTMYRADRRDVVADLRRTPSPTPAECRGLPALRLHGIHGTRYPAGSPEKRRRASTRSWRDLGRLPMAAMDRVVLPRLHTSGCGDFMLASRSIWSRIRGYPEWPIFSWQLDGLGLFEAYAAGARMVNLEEPMAAIHLEHSQGSGWTPAGSRGLFERLRRDGVPYLTTGQYRRHARRIVRARRFQPYNDADWGLATRDLPAVDAGSDVSQGHRA